MADRPAEGVRRVVILGAAGRDFHDFNVAYRDDPTVRVVAFTATQIPDIARRRYPPVLAGPRYPEGIPIVPEAELEALIARERVDEVAFAYSDVSYGHVMATATRALAAGAAFRLLAPRATMLRSRRPVVAVVAVRTGAGKSPAARRIAALLRDAGVRVGILRHPMPYGDLARQAVQRFASLADLHAQGCTIEEMEEYEPHLAAGDAVFVGVDTARALAAAEAACDVVLWDGGNNDTAFVAPDLTVCCVDPHRAGHEASYHPGATNLRLADVVLLTKLDSAPPEAVARARAGIAAANPRALVVDSTMPVTVDVPGLVGGRRALVIEDGPTCTHGGMASGAGALAARAAGAAALVDPRPWAVGSIRRAFAEHPHLERVLPALGYGASQVADLEATIAAVPCDVVVIATPIDLRRVVRIGQPTVRVRYELRERGRPTLAEALAPVIARCRPAARAAAARVRRV